MYLAFWKDRIFSVHELVKKNTNWICIIGWISWVWIIFEGWMIEIRHIWTVSKFLFKGKIQRNRFTYFWNSIFNVDISYMEHVQRSNLTVMDIFQGLNNGKEEELYLIFFQCCIRSFQPFYIVLYSTIVGILGYGHKGSFVPIIV